MEKEQVNSMEEQLKNDLKSLFCKEEFALHQQLIQRLVVELQVTALDLAAALSLLKQPEILVNNQAKVDQPVEKVSIKTAAAALPKQKLVRYRLDIGRKHAVSVDEIKSVLIEVSGVDKNRIGRLDMRNYYSLVDLPDGMPADVFQLLAEVEMNKRKLNLKRVKYKPRFYRRKNRQ
jgi:ATP-dependent RNA helicase DeaD